jgi:hypothetical protein
MPTMGHTLSLMVELDAGKTFCADIERSLYSNGGRRINSGVSENER